MMIKLKVSPSNRPNNFTTFFFQLIMELWKYGRFWTEKRYDRFLYHTK